MSSLGLILIFGAFLSLYLVSASPRIIRGEEARQGEFPWQVELLVSNPLTDDLTACTGVLISDEWILTAAHCISNARDIQIIAGAVNTSDPNAVIVQSWEEILHEDYDVLTLRSDIGLLHLDKPLPLDDNIQPISLAEEEPEPGTDVTVSGWGMTTNGNDEYSDILRYTTVTTISNSECEAYFGPEWVLPTVLCAEGGHPARGPCFGDGGAPLILNFVRESTVVGIFSFISGQGCESGFPAGYTRISVYRDWIRRISGI